MQHATTIRAATNATNVAAAVVTGSITIAAIFVLGHASENATQHAALVLGASSISVLALWFGLRHERSLRAWAIGGIVATLGLGVVVGGVLARPTMVDEQVVMAGPAEAMEADEPGAPADTMAKDDRAPARNVLLASGSFTPLEHAGRGTAKLIRTADGTNVLTLTDFETDAGPDLVVLLAAGDPKHDGDVEQGRTVRLGKLKGTSGDQQYVLPEGVDPAEFTHAYVWCRAFSVGFTRARLA